MDLAAEIPRKFLPLLSSTTLSGKPVRYRGAHGGRGGAKSHFFAEQLIIKCWTGTVRWACLREVQNTLRDSVYQLLIKKIEKFGLGDQFDVRANEIRCLATGSLIIFRGMQSYNAENIKSLEDFDGAWVEEAQTLSERSLRLLRPTIRKAGSEIWFSWNPRYETDAVDEFLRGSEDTEPPDTAVVIEVNWRDNPWFNDVLREELELDFRNDPEMAEHVWNGGYEIITKGAYYATLIAEAEAEGRCGNFPHNPGRIVRTGWDIGIDDFTAVWFIQDDGVNAWAVDFFEANGLGAQQVVGECLPEYLPDLMERAEQRVLIGRPAPFKYGDHYLPHDVKNREWGAGAKSRVQTLMELGLKSVHKGAQQGPAERINAVRQVLPLMHFNVGLPGMKPTPAQRRVRAGLNRLRRYSRRWNEALTTFTTVAEHDVNSHAADAFGEWAINAALIAPRPKIPQAQSLPKPGQVRLPPPPDHSPQRHKLRV